jgi:hypothetical protein
LFANSVVQLFEEKLSKPQDLFVIDEQSANYIFYMAGGQPGIIGFLLAKIFENTKNYQSYDITTCTARSSLTFDS